MDSLAKAVDTRISVLDDTLTLAVRVWHPPNSSLEKPNVNGLRCIAYPGWLDNVGSFETIAPILCSQLDITIAAIDPPGCGWSDHRAHGSSYADYEEPPLIGDVADGLGWNKFGLIGHSRGGAICAIAAALFPERVLCLIAFDSGLGLSGVWVKDLKPGAPTPVQRMRMARAQQHRNRQRKMTVFQTLEEAIHANANNTVFKKSERTARNIVLRHIRPAAAGGFTFTHDMRTYGQVQYLCITEDQTRAFLGEIICPVLKISCRPEATRYPEELRKYFADRTKCIRDLTEVVVPGGHHVHSDDPSATADAVIRWLDRRRLSTRSSKL